MQALYSQYNSKINVMCHNYIGSDTHAHVFPHDGLFPPFFLLLFVLSIVPSRVSHIGIRFFIWPKKYVGRQPIACTSNTMYKWRLSLTAFLYIYMLCCTPLLFCACSQTTHSPMLSLRSHHLKQCKSNNDTTIFAVQKLKVTQKCTATSEHWISLRLHL